MSFIVKSDPKPLAEGQRAWIPAKRYLSADPKAGDTVYLWHSETAGGTGLVARAVIDAVSDEDPVDLALTVIEANPDKRFGVAELKAHRDLDDGSPIGGLAKKLYRHSHNKIAELTVGEAALLAGHWATKR